MHIMVFMMHFLAFTQVKIRVRTNAIVTDAEN
jgi:hypothetical protein